MLRVSIIRGHHAAADALRNQAKEIVEYIADRIGTSELCASFLDLPQVRKVMRIA